MASVTGAKDTMVMSHCVDATTDKLMQEFGRQQPQMNRKACKEDMRNEAGKMIVYRETCQQGKTKVTTHLVMSGDFNSQYNLQVTTSYDPPSAGKTEESMRMDATWKGSCAAGQRPGDMVMPGGIKMNILDVMKAMPGAAQR